jgi:hypothetical protein
MRFTVPHIDVRQVLNTLALVVKHSDFSLEVVQQGASFTVEGYTQQRLARIRFPA